MAIFAGLTNLEAPSSVAQVSGSGRPRTNAFVIRAIEGYQRHGQRIAACRFQPSCSVYGKEAFERYGLGRASLKTTWRLVRCNPWNRGSTLDPV